MFSFQKLIYYCYIVSKKYILESVKIPFYNAIEFLCAERAEIQNTHVQISNMYNVQWTENQFMALGWISCLHGL